MENPLFKVYQSLDDCLMYGTNKAVQTWNWTTGRTKSELANTLLSIASVSESTAVCIYGFSTLEFIPLATIASASSVHCTHLIQKENASNEQRERSALEKSCLDSEVEKNKSKYCFWGVVFGATGTGILLTSDALGNKVNDVNAIYKKAANSLVGTGFVIRSVANYVMRADNLPPRKDCVNRAIAQVKDICEGLRVVDPTF